MVVIGNLVDAWRSFGNGTNNSSGSGANGKSGAPSNIPLFQVIDNYTSYSYWSTTPTHITYQEEIWATWSSIIHGARGILSFLYAHGFSGTGEQAAIASNNAAIKSLASVINSPFALSYLTSISPHGYLFPTFESSWLNGGIEAMAKWDGSNFWIFATTRYGEAANPINQSAIFSISDASATSVTIEFSTDGDQGNTISISAGSFTDTFANSWSVKIYKVT